MKIKLTSAITFLVLLASITRSYGQSQQVCSISNIPKGWVITDIENCLNCCGSPSGYEGTKWTITKIDGMQTGTSITVCSLQNLPIGWVVTYIEDCYNCCGTPPANMGTWHVGKGRKWTIKKIE